MVVASLRSALSKRQQRRLNRALQSAIVVILLAGIALRNISVVINAVLSLIVTFLPALLRRDWDIQLDPGLVLWITLAVFFHSLGMVMLYQTVWWWDHLTHTLSGTLVAAVGYTTTRALDEYSDAVAFPAAFLWVYLFLFTVAFGVLWEVLELGGRELARTFGMRPVLQVYGIEDTVYDLLFDMFGAIIVAVLGPYRLGHVVENLATLLEAE